MTTIVLLGAGFSKNWGGPLARHVFNWLLAHPAISSDATLRQILWDHKDAGGFENALAEVQRQYLSSPLPEYKARLERFQTAINDMFGDMERGFATNLTWEFQNDTRRTLIHALVKFDAIFTLNQDLLFERFYLDPWQRIAPASQNRWDRAIIPGMREQRDGSSVYEPARSLWVPEPDRFRVPQRMQPYVKLHGSYRWEDGSGNRLMVMGASKGLTIAAHAVLKWYFAEFQRYLSMGDTRLMVIGYGFNDPHINDALHAATVRGLKMFIIDPLGADVADPTRNLPIRMPNPFKDIIDGVSQEPLSATFGSNAVEHGMVMKFLGE